MTEDIQLVLDTTRESMQDSIVFLENQLTKIRAGKATPSMLDSVMVDYYGSPTPLQQVGNVKSLDARTLVVQPWEKAMLEPIEKAITNANLGLNPQNNGETIIINVPQLTEERRRDLTKKVKAEGEHAKVGIRNARKEANEEIRNLQKDGLSEDLAKDAEDQVQKLTDQFTARVDRLIEAKEKDIMTV